MKNNRKSRFKVALVLVFVLALTSCSLPFAYEIPSPMRGTWMDRGHEYKVSAKKVLYRSGSWDTWHTIIDNNVRDVYNEDNYDYYHRTYYCFGGDSLTLAQSKDPSHRNYLIIDHTTYSRVL